MTIDARRARPTALPPLTEAELFAAYGDERPGDWSVEEAEAEQERQRPSEDAD